MISVTFTSDVENIVATEHLYQWDNGQKLSISGVGTTADIHFANKKSEKALVVTPTVTSGAMVAFIPNSLLTEPYPIIAYVYVPSDDGSKTIKSVTINVEARKQPSDFVLDEDEGVTTLETISQRANEVLQNATNQINTAVSNMNADYGNFKTTIQSELADMVANTTIPNADTVDGLHANEIASNPNLLVNPDFKINQRGQTTYTGPNGYCVDRWYRNTNVDLSVEDVGITLTVKNTSNSTIYQYIKEVPWGRNVTASIALGDGTTETASGVFPKTTPTTNVVILRKAHLKVQYIISLKAFIFIITATGDVGAVTSVKWAKLELGSIATSFTPPDSDMELLKIQAKDGTIHANTANTANTAGTLATTPTNVCLRNISFGTADPQVTDPSAEGYVAPGALYGQYEEVTT